MKQNILTVILFCFSLGVFSQTSDLGNWIIYIGNKKINKTWNWHNEIQYRNYNAIGDLEQLLLRTGIGYNITPTNNFLLGYGYITSENYVPSTTNKNTVNEHRIYQQFSTKQKIGKLNIGHRYRFEQRFVSENFKMRFRYFLSLKYPLKQKEGNYKWYASAYNEVFLNTKTTVFDRNRLFGGIGYKLNKTLRIELGYMNQFFNQSNRDQINIITFFNF